MTSNVPRALLIACCLGTSAWAQSAQPADLNQLKAKLDQLEQMMQDLKQQIAAAEAGQQQAPAQPLITTPTTPAKNVPTPQLPTDFIGDLTRTRVSVNEDQEGAPRIDNESIDPTLRGYFRLPGTGTLIKMGGFVKTDVFIDTNIAGSYYGGYVPASFPSSPQPHTVNSTVSMRASRFFVDFRQPVGGASDTDTNDSVQAYIEYDFLSNYDRNSLRLRQFYAQYKNLLVGQSWSAFSDPDVWPDTLDPEGPPGTIGLRQPMIKYTHPLNDSNSIGVSVEKSGTDAPFATQYGAPVSSSQRPDLVGFYRYENKHGHLYFAGISRSVGGLVANTEMPNLENHVDGFGGSLSGAWGSSKNNVVFQAVLGKGISNYYNDNYGLGSDVGFNAAGKLVATPSGSATFGFQHYWNKLLRSSVSYGYLRINNTAQDPGTNYHISNYGTVNLIAQPSPSLLFGGEYTYGSLLRKDGFEWVAPRIQLSVTYYINKYRE